MIINAEPTSVPATPEQLKSGRVLQVGPLMPDLQDALAADYNALVLPGGDDRPAFLARWAGEITVVVTSGTQGVGTALMRELPALQAVVNFGVGYDTTDVRQATERGISISNTPDVLTDCVADTAIALLLDVLRQFSAADRYVRGGKWIAARYPLTTSVSGKKIGIVGLGRIGGAIADRLGGFGCEISYHNRREVAGSPYRYSPSVLQLAQESDVLIVAAAGGADTQHLVSADVIAAIGPDGYLVNVARGSVVDQDALVRALVEGSLGGAGLDVFEDEPHVPAELLGLNTVVLLPHLASGTVETRRAMVDLTLANLDRFLADGSLLTPVPAP